MRSGGVLPEDAPDPQDDVNRRASTLPVPIIGFAPQPSLEDPGMLSVAAAGGGENLDEMSVSVSYTLWRNPADHDDPVNLADLGDRTRASLDAVPPWPRPAWLVERVERMRFPLLWEAARTTWRRDPSARPVEELLRDHADYVLANQFREELRLPLEPWSEPGWRIPAAAVRARHAVEVDGRPVAAIEVDTDPFVYALGAELEGGGILTVVIPRDELRFLRLEFATRRA